MVKLEDAHHGHRNVGKNAFQKKYRNQRHSKIKHVTSKNSNNLMKKYHNH